MTALLRRLATALLVVVVAGLGLPFSANAQSPAHSGGITLGPATGTDITLLSGATSGPCTAAGANGLQVWVTGPGPFAPNDAAGRLAGVALQAATPTGFSRTAPNTFTSRAGFLDFARELGLSAVPPGTYVVDFRCVDVDFTTVFQTYRATLTFTTPTSYAISGAAPATGGAPPAGSPPADGASADTAPVAPSPLAGVPGQAGSAQGAPGDGSYGPVDRTAGSAGSTGPNTALVVVIVIAAVLAAAAVAYAIRLRKLRRVSASSSPRS